MSSIAAGIVFAAAVAISFAPFIVSGLRSQGHRWWIGGACLVNNLFGSAASNSESVAGAIICMAIWCGLLFYASTGKAGKEQASV